LAAVAEILGYIEDHLFEVATILVGVIYIAYRLVRFIRWFLEQVYMGCRENQVTDMPVVFTKYRVSGQIGCLKVNGQVDEVRRSTDGVLVLVQEKVRKSAVVREDDIVELSLLRALFVQSVPAGQLVAIKGFINVVNRDTGTEGVCEVALYDDERVQNLARAYYNVQTGRREARKRNLVKVCGSCQHLRACYPRLHVDDDDDNGGVYKDEGFGNYGPGWSIGGVPGGLGYPDFPVDERG